MKHSEMSMRFTLTVRPTCQNLYILPIVTIAMIIINKPAK